MLKVSLYLAIVGCASRFITVLGGIEQKLAYYNSTLFDQYLFTILYITAPIQQCFSFHCLSLSPYRCYKPLLPFKQLLRCYELPPQYLPQGKYQEAGHFSVNNLGVLVFCFSHARVVLYLSISPHE